MVWQGLIAGGNKEEAIQIASKMGEIDVNQNIYPSGRVANIPELERSIPSSRGCDTLIGWAVANNQYNLYKEIVKNPEYEENNCALGLSLTERNAEAFTDLLENGASPNARYSGLPILQTALQKGLTRKAKTLLDKGANTNFTLSLSDGENRNSQDDLVSPLEYAVIKNMTDLYEILLEGATPEQARRLLSIQQENNSLDFAFFKLVDEKTGYIESMSEQARREFILGLFPSGRVIRMGNHPERGTIKSYSLNKDLMIAYFFEKEYLPTDILDNERLPILYTATYYAYPETVKTLLDKGVNPNSTYLPDRSTNEEKVIGFVGFSNSFRLTTSDQDLVEEYYSRSEKILKDFVDKGMDLNTEELNYIVQNMISWNQIKSLQLVLNNSNFDINAKLDEHSTPLEIATSDERIGSLRLLLKNDAKITKNALFHRNTFKNKEVLEMFIDNGIDVNSTMNVYNIINQFSHEIFLLTETILQTQEEDIVFLVKKLLEKGADPNKVTKKGIYTEEYLTPLIATIMRHNLSSDTKLELVKILVEKGADVNKCTPLLDNYSCPLASAIYDDSRGEIVEYLKEQGAKCEGYEKVFRGGVCTQKP